MHTAVGSGDVHRWSGDDLRVVRAVTHLATLHAGRDVLAGAVRTLTATPLAEWTGYVVFTADGRTWPWLRDSRQAVAYVLDLAACR